MTQKRKEQSQSGGESENLARKEGKGWTGENSLGLREMVHLGSPPALPRAEAAQVMA